MGRRQDRDRSDQAGLWEGSRGISAGRVWGLLLSSVGSQAAACLVFGGQPDLAHKNPRGPVTFRFQVNSLI